MSICFVGGSRFMYVIYIYYVYWCPSKKTCNWTTWTTYQMVFVLVKCITSLIEQKLITIPEHPTSSPIFSGVRVSQSLVVCVAFCRSLFVLLPLCRFYFGHCIVCPSIYDSEYPHCHQSGSDRLTAFSYQHKFHFRHLHNYHNSTIYLYLDYKNK